MRPIKWKTNNGFTNMPKKLNDLNAVLYHSCVSRSASDCVHHIQTSAFFLRHGHFPCASNETKSIGQRSFSSTGPALWNSWQYTREQSVTPNLFLFLKLHPEHICSVLFLIPPCMLHSEHICSVLSISDSSLYVALRTHRFSSVYF